MATREECGNDYPLSFEIHTMTGDRHALDSLACAVHRLAPVCEHCGCRLMGHGMDVDGHVFCSAHTGGLASAATGGAG